MCVNVRQNREDIMSDLAEAAFPPPIPSQQKQTLRTSDVDSPHVPLLEAERRFYNQYNWCLNPFLTIREVISHLQKELDRLVDTDAGWQLDEICTNIYLLSCSILDS